MREVFICDAARTAIGRYAGSLAKVRTDDLAAAPIRALVARNPHADWTQLDEVFLGCANQAGEDGRNVARMACLLAGLPAGVSAVTVNRLCGSGMDAIGSAARAIKAGEASLMMAGGVESMSRVPMGSDGGAMAIDPSAAFEHYFTPQGISADLIATLYGFSRDDVEAAFCSTYLDHGIFPVSPFESLDVDGVGQLVRTAVERGRSARPDLHLGICGEHGGDPASIAFCESTGLDYVSASPYRVPIARLAAAQAALRAG